MTRRIFGQLATIVGVTAALSLFSQKRLEIAGSWFPTLPSTIAHWEGTIQPVSQGVLALLGFPQAATMEYSNGTNNTVTATLVTAGPFENFHDPTVCVGGSGIWKFTAQKEFLLDGAGTAPVRAMIFRRSDRPNFRIIMYYWQQGRDGFTTCEPMMGNFRDLPARLRTGYGAVVLGRKSVILRIYEAYDENEDIKGISAQRSVHTISQEIYRELLKLGKESL